MSTPSSSAADPNSQPDPPANPNPNYLNSAPPSLLQPSFRPVAPPFPPSQFIPQPPGVVVPPASAPQMNMQYAQQMRLPFMPYPGMPRFASPYPAVVRPPFPPRPLGAVGGIPPLTRPPVLLRAPIVPPVVRPPPIVAPIEKPQTIVYVGKIASRVDNDFMLSLLQLCGPVKSWKRYQDPSSGTLKSFGFCEFESAEGVMRALRLLSKLNIDGQELMLKVDQATREHLERYVAKKVETSKTSKETENKESEKEEVSEVVADGNESEATHKAKLDGCENQENHEPASFGLVTDEDRATDHEVLEKLTGMLEERMKNMPLPPPPPLTPANASSNSEIQREGESDEDARRKGEGKEEISDNKPASEHERTEQSSPDRSRKDERRGKDRERDLKREKERDLERIEREREQERAKREKERDYKIREDERRYKVREKDWEVREKEKEHHRKREREREKERAQERKWDIVDQEREVDDGYNKRRKHRSSDEERRRRQREKEEDVADKSREEEEIAESKRKAEEEAQNTLQLEALKALTQHADNGIAKPSAPDEEYIASEEKRFEQTSDHDEDNAGEGILQNGAADELEGHHNSNAPVRKLGFGLSGSGKRTAVPSVFYEDEEEDKRKDKKMRPLVPLDYSTEEQQAVQPPTPEAPVSNLAAAAEFAKRISNVNSKEEKPDVDRERSRRHHDRSSQRNRDRHDGDSKNVRDESKESSGRDKVRDHGADKVKTIESKKLLDAKQLIDMIPKTKEELFSYKINWDIYEEHNLHERMKPWISKKITEFLGEEEPTLVDYIVSTTHDHVKASKMLENLQAILDEEAEMFVLKMWRMLIFEVKKVETAVNLIKQNKNAKLHLVVFNYRMAEAVFEKVSETVEKGSHQVQENVSETVGNVTESVAVEADAGKEEAKEKVAETKNSITSLFSHGFSKAEGLVHNAKDFVDQRGADFQGKVGEYSGSLASLVKTKPGASAEQKSEEADPLPVSGGSSSPPPVGATDRGLPENQPLLSGTTQTQTSWTNCCGLFDCLRSSDR